MPDRRSLNSVRTASTSPRRVPVSGVSITSTSPRRRITALSRSNLDGQRRYNTERADDDLAATASMVNRSYPASMS
jgi:hypothetical protein